MYEPWFVYLLRCRDGTLYCGITNNLEKRLGAHGRGRVKYTRGRLPVAIAHVETVADKSAALRAEAAWKRLTRKQKLARMTASTCVFGAATLSDKNAKAPSRRPRSRRV